MPDDARGTVLVIDDDQDMRWAIRTVLTLVKVLHDVLERQAVRRMDGGNLTPAQIEAVGAGLLAQEAEIELLRRHFGFPERELALNLGLSERCI